MSDALLHYVCDRCGHMWAGFADDGWERCVSCDHDAIWEFVLQKSAREHAATVAALHASKERSL